MLAASLQAGIKTDSGGNAVRFPSSGEWFDGISIYCRECHQARHQQRHQRVAVKTPVTFKTTNHSNIHFLFKKHLDVSKLLVGLSVDQRDACNRHAALDTKNFKNRSLSQIQIVIPKTKGTDLHLAICKRIVEARSGVSFLCEIPSEFKLATPSKD